MTQDTRSQGKPLTEATLKPEEARELAREAAEITPEPSDEAATGNAAASKTAPNEVAPNSATPTATPRANGNGTVRAATTPPVNGREPILGRIRRALRVKAPRAGHHNGHDGAPIDSPVVDNLAANTLPVEGAPGGVKNEGNGSQFTGVPPANGSGNGAANGTSNGQPQFVSTLPILGQSNSPRAWLPLVGESEAEQLALFEAHTQDLRATLHVCASQDEATAYVRQLAQSEGWTRVGAHHGALTDAAASGLGLPLVWVDSGYDKLALEACEAGLTECDALVAQTGSALVTSRSQGGRGLSILPPHHVILARRDQLVPDLPAAFGLLRAKYGADIPSMMSFITGPSRTGDIERILVLGAHGPKQLTIVVF